MQSSHFGFPRNFVDVKPIHVDKVRHNTIETKIGSDFKATPVHFVQDSKVVGMSPGHMIDNL